jgi:peroxiredoxin
VVVGISAMDPAEQAAFAEREEIPYPLLNDGPLRLRDELGLPTFEVHGMTLYKRLAFVAAAGRIEKVFYPIFPPDRNAEDVERYLKSGRP